MSNETILNKLRELSSHGTRFEDIEMAFNAGITVERERLGMDAPPMEEPISERLQGHDLSILSERALTILWEKFSEIQCAAWITIDDNSIERFIAWAVNGDDNDAYS